jgi:hypothetical protein
MKMDVIQKYKEIRQDHVGRWTGTGKIYHHKVTAESAWKSAKYIVDVEQRWQLAEDNEQVRFRVEYDELADYENLAGDSFNPEVNTDIQPHILEREEREFIDKINREGVWGIIGEFWNGEEWIQADSVWGFVGDDWKGSGYDLDVKWSTLDQLSKVERCECCRRPKL